MLVGCLLYLAPGDPDSQFRHVIDALVFTPAPPGPESSWKSALNSNCKHQPVNTRRSANVGTMLAQRRRRWANIVPTSAERLVFVGCNQPRLVRSMSMTTLPKIGPLVAALVQLCVIYSCSWSQTGGGPRVVVSTAAFHARVRGLCPSLRGFKET